MPRPVNQTEVRIVGLSRSGLHAFADWMLTQSDGPALYLNAVEGKRDPFESARPLDSGLPYDSNESDLLQGDPEDLRHTPRHLLAIGHEDSYLAHAFSDWFEEHHDDLVGTSDHRTDVILLRDPFNLFASRLHTGVGEVDAKIALRIWKQHARAATGRTRRLPRRPLVVSYNRWCRDPEYRREIARTLRLNEADNGLDRVPGTFGGSSFDGTAYDGQAHRMRVFERWRHLIDDPGYHTLFDDGTMDFAQKLFTEGPGGQEVAAAIDAVTARRARGTTPTAATPSQRGRVRAAPSVDAAAP